MIYFLYYQQVVWWEGYAFIVKSRFMMQNYTPVKTHW